MKRHAPKTSKNTEALRYLLSMRTIRNMWRTHGKTIRVRYGKGKPGFDWSQIRVFEKNKFVGVVHNALLK